MQNSSLTTRLLPPGWVITLLVLALIGWLVSELKEIVILLVVGYAISYLIEPCLDYLERRQIRRGVGIFVTGGCALIVVLLLTITALPTLMREYGSLVDRLPQNIATARERVVPYLNEIETHLPKRFSDLSSAESLVDTASKAGEGLLQAITTGLGAALLQGYSLTLTLVNLALLPFIVFYLSLDFRGLHRAALKLVPIAHRPLIKSMFGEIDADVSAYVRGQLTVGAILFGLYSLGLGIVGVELWFVLALISGFGNLIPYLGFLVGIVLSSIMALVTFHDFSHLGMVWGVYAVVQFLEGTFITPRIVGSKVGLSPLTVILSIVAFGKLLGLLGVFLAIPIAAIIRVLGRQLYRAALSEPIEIQPEAG